MEKIEGMQGVNEKCSTVDRILAATVIPDIFMFSCYFFLHRNIRVDSRQEPETFSKICPTIPNLPYSLVLVLGRSLILSQRPVLRAILLKLLVSTFVIRYLTIHYPSFSPVLRTTSWIIQLSARQPSTKLLGYLI